jgi:hypothetical protein
MPSPWSSSGASEKMAFYRYFLMGREGFEPSTLGLRDRSIGARPLFSAVLGSCEVLSVRSGHGSSGHGWDMSSRRD